jgi:hypothetical protein
MLKGVYYFVEEDGRKPVKEFIDSLTEKEQAVGFYAYITELKNQGHNPHRPMADYLRDGITCVQNRLCTPSENVL